MKPTQALHEAGHSRRLDSAHRFQGAIFDVDGVLVDSPHYRAWRDALQELMDTEWHLRRRCFFVQER